MPSYAYIELSFIVIIFRESSNRVKNKSDVGFTVELEQDMALFEIVCCDLHHNRCIYIYTYI